MWIEELKNGKFKVVERYMDPMTEKYKRISVTIDKNTRATRKAAEEELRRKIDEATLARISQEITLKELTALYIEQKKQRAKMQTWMRDELMCNIVIKILGEDVYVSKLTARYVSEKINGSGKPVVTLNTYYSHFKRLMRWAYKADYVEDISFLDKLQIPQDRDKKERIEDKFLESSELAALLDGMKIRRWKLLTEFLALSGLRIGEALALNNEDVTDVIVVNKTFDPMNKRISDNPKTADSNREVYIQPELAEVVRQIRTYFLTDQLKHNYRSNLFFSSQLEDGYAAYLKYLKDTSETVIHHKITPHALRHTHVSLLAENGVPLEMIARRVGHKDSRITRQIYFHVTEKQREKDNEMLKNIKIL